MYNTHYKYLIREWAEVFAHEIDLYQSRHWFEKSDKFSTFLLDYYWGTGNVTMARKRATVATHTSKSAAGKSKPAVWYNYKLTQEDVGTILSDCDDVGGLCTRLAGIFASGADFSIRYVPERKNYSAFVIAVGREDDSERIALSAFGGTVWQALASVLFKCDLLTQSPEAFGKSGENLGLG